MTISGVERDATYGQTGWRIGQRAHVLTIGRLNEAQLQTLRQLARGETQLRKEGIVAQIAFAQEADYLAAEETLKKNYPGARCDGWEFTIERHFMADA